jgi:hypothetical protein
MMICHSATEVFTLGELVVLSKEKMLVISYVFAKNETRVKSVDL